MSHQKQIPGSVSQGNAHSIPSGVCVCLSLSVHPSICVSVCGKDGREGGVCDWLEASGAQGQNHCRFTSMPPQQLWTPGSSSIGQHMGWARAQRVPHACQAGACHMPLQRGCQKPRSWVNPAMTRVRLGAGGRLLVRPDCSTPPIRVPGWPRTGEGGVVNLFGVLALRLSQAAPTRSQPPTRIQAVFYQQSDSMET